MKTWNARAEALSKLALSRRMELNVSDVGQLSALARNARRSNARAKAFTLAELLMAILVISIIMVALAPVITRRAYDNVSIEVNKKKGLEIFTNPGIYSFDVPVGINTLFIQGAAGGGGGGGATYIDKEITFNASTNWTVPKGVSQLTFTLIGAGGGGGGGYGQTGSETCPSPYIKLPYMADNGRDLCFFNKNMDDKLAFGRHGAALYIARPGEITTLAETCYRWDGNLDIGTTMQLAPGGIAPNKRMACSKGGATRYCDCYLPGEALNWKPTCYGTNPDEVVHIARLIKAAEMERILNASPAPNFKYLTPQYLDMYGMNIAKITNKVTSNWVTTNCPFPNSSGYCHHGLAPMLDGYYYWSAEADYTGNYQRFPEVRRSSGIFDKAGIPICVYEIRDWTPYGGGGGASGAKLTQTINVLPNDILKITVGNGGARGNAGSNGGSGGRTQIVHMRGTQTKGTYYADGAVGGFRATTSGPGGATTTTIGCSSNCNSRGSSGAAGSESSGGAGANGINTAGSAVAGASGGTSDSSAGKDAQANSGAGGGGAYCPRGTKSPGSCSKGGLGGSGRVDIKYRIMLPGAGGGSGARVGGLNADNKAYEIKYKVTEGSRIVIEVGAGGSGGSVGQNGLNATPTIVGDNDIVFLAGQGGFALTQEKKDNLSSCIGSTTNSSTIINCINSNSYKPQIGLSSTVKQDNQVQTNALGLLIKNSSNVSYTFTPPSNTFKGNDGKTANYYSSITIVPFSYGFDGGVGGTPFGIRSNNIPASVSCGGGMVGAYGSVTDKNAYICTSGSPDANNARVHDPVNNEFGGSGGGGGGVVVDSLTLGSGGNGASGYLRIRWDESEQE